ncbi:hypothetical protein AFLA70_164g002081 [Aspergillus flavus AF70]|nr:hypothetical protein AFLA70_164g002081 [Aspergillus flavus AF70]
MARRFGLSNPQVVMTSKRETGTPQCMFQLGKRCYIWNEMDDMVWQITKPVGVMAILRTMVTKGEKALKVKEVEPAEDYNDEDDNDTPAAFVVQRRQGKVQSSSSGLVRRGIGQAKLPQGPGALCSTGPCTI